LLYILICKAKVWLTVQAHLYVSTDPLYILRLRMTRLIFSQRVIARNSLSRTCFGKATSAKDNQGTSMSGEGYRRMHVGHLASGARAHLFLPARILARGGTFTFAWVKCSPTKIIQTLNAISWFFRGLINRFRNIY